MSRLAEELPRLGLADLRVRLAEGGTSSRELAETCLARIAATQPRLGAFAVVMAETALAEAAAADTRRARGAALGPFDGLPVAVKDICDIAGLPTAAGAATRQDRIAAGTAAIIGRLRALGMVVLGKTSMVELALGGWGTNPLLGTPRNPWDARRARAPGGSSSGSAVAVAAGLVPIALGSDTGGSIRLPAAFNGISGLKTTPGLLPLEGTFALSPTLDTLGFLARRAGDVMAMTAAAAGSAIPPPSHGQTDLRGRRLAVIAADALPDSVDAGQRIALAAAADVFRALGAVVTEVASPLDFAGLQAANSRIILHEAWRLHHSHVGHPAQDVDPAVRERLLMAREIPDADYVAARRQRQQAMADWDAWIAAHDALLMPCTTSIAPPLDTLATGWSSPALLTSAGNLVDAAALALPTGFSADGLPTGAQLMGPAFGERQVSALGMAYQQATAWHLHLPPCDWTTEAAATA